MADELKHLTVGGEYTQTEFEAIGRHHTDGQALSDIFIFNGTYWVSLAHATMDIGTLTKLLRTLYAININAQYILNPDQPVGPSMEIVRTREIRHPDPAANEPVRVFDILEILAGLHNLKLVAATEEFGVGIRTIVIQRQWGDALFDAGALNDSDTIWTQPAGSTLLGIKYELVEQFAGAGPVTDMDVTVGDAGDNIGLLNPGAHDLVDDAVGSQYKTRGQYWDAPVTGGPEPCFAYTHAAKAWLAYSTAVGGNMNVLTAGIIKFIITYLEI